MRTFYLQDASSHGEPIFIPHAVSGLSALVTSVDAHGGQSVLAARHEALHQIMGMACELGRQTWLVAGHSYAVPDNSMAAYHRLWRGLARRGIEFATASGNDAVKSASDEGVRYFGYRPVGSDDVASVENVLRVLQSFLVVADDEAEAAKMIESGWASTGVGVPPEAFQRSLEYGITIAFLFGDFDDPTVEGILVGRPEAVNAFAIPRPTLQ